MTKHNLRRDLLRRRRQLQPQAVRAFGSQLQSRFVQSSWFERSKALLLYSPIQNEVATGLILQSALRQKKIVVYPRVRGAHLELVRVGGYAELVPGSYGIREPSGHQLCDFEQVDLVVVPGVAFDRRGHRLGYGKGFYDRLLHNGDFQGNLVGFCYGFQLVDVLPAEAHDVPVDCVMTEKETLVMSPA